MLGKLLKHEWREIWKIPAILLGILLVVSVFAGSTFFAPVWDSELSGLGILAMLVWMLYYFAIIGVSIGVTLYLAIHFYKTMFTDEGYLTHTLPVTSHELLLSKILPMMAWQMLATVAILISVAIFGSMAILALHSDGLTFREVYRQIFEVLAEEGFFGNMSLIGFITSMLCAFLAGIVSGAMMIVGSVSIGQMVGKHKVLGSIGAYFAINTVVQILSCIVFVPVVVFKVSNEMPESVFDVLTPCYFGMSVLAILVSVGLYFLSEYLIRRKLNLD
ncbi:MAG: hypothetical protein J6C12_02550 [Lachnospiraceae bacterium]|nr:hypothetical protein [Lachnospiraceae bacterium]